MTDTQQPEIPDEILESPEAWETRRQFRDELIDAIRDRLDGMTLTITDGAMDGVSVVTDRNWREALSEALGAPLPPVDHHHAEVLTDAIVTVWAKCPRCGISASMLLTVGPELRVDPVHAELHLKAKSKGRHHVCGQLPLPAGVAEGQVTIEDLIGPPDESEDEPMPDPEPVACPWPGCTQPADHAGAHTTVVDDLPGGDA